MRPRRLSGVAGGGTCRARTSSNPRHLLAELQRDRRWCQGNIQNAGLIAEPGLHGVHRAMLVTGALSYLAAPLWLLYVGLGVLLLERGRQRELPSLHERRLARPRRGRAVAGNHRHADAAAPAVGGRGHPARRARPVRRRAQAAGQQRDGSADVAAAGTAAHGGALDLLRGGADGHLAGMEVPPASREDVSWREAFAAFGRVSAITAVFAAVVGWMSPSTLMWMAPIALPLLLAAPITVLSSRARLGERLRAAGLMVIPEESRTPTVLSNAWAYGRQERRLPGWTELVASRRLTALAAEAMGRREIGHGVRARVRDRRLVELAAQPGALEALTNAERMRFLSEPAHLVRLAQPHRQAAGQQELRLAA
ncbi:glucans biosynthesis glucosyltransferase H [Ditylenchus destructor]|nr:glucans biosynthesis glucosyltransferase H [Ditylenchus destructor]